MVSESLLMKKKINIKKLIELRDLLVPFTFRPMILLDPLGCVPAGVCGPGGAVRPVSSPGLSISHLSLAHINPTPANSKTSQKYSQLYENIKKSFMSKVN